MTAVTGNTGYDVVVGGLRCRCPPERERDAPGCYERPGPTIGP
jgi:hypothetical protein